MKIEKVMVTASRRWGQCTLPRPDHSGTCPTWSAHHRVMWNAFAALRLDLQGHPVTLYHGGARGGDRMAVEIWEAQKLGPVVPFLANWAELGRRAGHVRNGLMVAHMPDVCLAFPLPGSIGTHDASRQARDAGIWTRAFGPDGFELSSF